MNKKCRAVTNEEFEQIISTIQTGYIRKDGRKVQPSYQTAIILTVQANLGLRIGDVVKLTLSSFIRDGNRYRLDIIEEKTKKRRDFTVTTELYSFIQSYALQMKITNPKTRLFKIGVRAVQNTLQQAAEHLGMEGISTHTMRKLFAMSVYTASGYNIEVVRVLLNHCNSATSLRYLSISNHEIEKIIQGHITLGSLFRRKNACILSGIHEQFGTCFIRINLSGRGCYLRRIRHCICTRGYTK